MSDPTPVLFLDIDGVLNNHRPKCHGICGIDEERCVVLNRVFDAVDDCKIILHSAWRYQVLRGAMNCTGFGYMLFSHGLKSWGRVIAVTQSDEALGGRERQIMHEVEARGLTRWAVVDDMDLKIDNFVRTDPGRGISNAEAEQLIALLQGEP